MECLRTLLPCLAPSPNKEDVLLEGNNHTARHPLLSGGSRFLNDRISNATSHANFLHPTSCEGHGEEFDDTIHNDDNDHIPNPHHPTCKHSFTDVYTIKEQIGRGSTSNCFKAVHKRSGNVLAVKVIDKRRVAIMYPELLRQFREEVQVLSMLSHPHIVRLYEVFENESTLNVVTEFVQGGELFDYLVERPDRLLSEAEASFIVRQVAWAVAYMHSQGVMHRDLKLENILVSHRPSHDEDGPIVKLIDFGLAKRYTQVSASQQQEIAQLAEQTRAAMNDVLPKPTANTFFGTVGYIAPEMTKRKGYTASVDVWSLGVMTYVLLCGIFPFEDTDPADWTSSVREPPDYALRFPPWANKISDSAKDLLKKLLEVNPSRRLTAGKALQHPWVSGETASKSAVLGTPKLLEAMRLNQSYGSPTTYARTGTDSIAALYIPPEIAESVAEAFAGQNGGKGGSGDDDHVGFKDGGVSPLALDKRRG